MRGKVFVSWSKGKRSFRDVGNALEFASFVKEKYNEVPFIYDEI